MDCDAIEALLPDWWAETLSASDRQRVSEHLAACDRCRDEAETLGVLWRRLEALADEAPSERLRARFDTWVAGYAAARREAPTSAPATVLPFRRHWLHVAAGAAAVVLLGLAFLAGFLVEEKRAAPDVAALRQEVQVVRQMLAVSLLQQQSANERLRGLSVSLELDRPNQSVLTALVDTLERDSNVNVRLAAIDALHSFASERGARDGLIQSLERPQSPLVQIALIDALVDLGETRVKSTCEALAADDTVNEAVRARARSAVQQL
jgi:anti-sigma factor RsiW